MENTDRSNVITKACHNPPWLQQFTGNEPRPEFLATRETFTPLTSPEPHKKAG